MSLSKNEWLLVIFNLVYIIGFTLYYIFIGNYEFLVYIFVMIALFLLVFYYQRRAKFSNAILWGLSIWGLLHMMGGGVRFGDGVLYTLELIPLWVTDNFYILKYDQLVHGYLYFVMTFVVYHLMKPYVKNMPNLLLYLFVILISVGIGAGNEMIEFSTVLFFQETGVGGYYNNAWDLVFNTLGAIIAAFFIARDRKKIK